MFCCATPLFSANRVAVSSNCSLRRLRRFRRPPFTLGCLPKWRRRVSRKDYTSPETRDRHPRLPISPLPRWLHRGEAAVALDTVVAPLFGRRRCSFAGKIEAHVCVRFAQRRRRWLAGIPPAAGELIRVGRSPRIARAADARPTLIGGGAVSSRGGRKFCDLKKRNIRNIVRASLRRPINFATILLFWPSTNILIYNYFMNGVFIITNSVLTTKIRGEGGKQLFPAAFVIVLNRIGKGWSKHWWKGSFVPEAVVSSWLLTVCYVLRLFCCCMCTVGWIGFIERSLLSAGYPEQAAIKRPLPPYYHQNIAPCSFSYKNTMAENS